MSLKPTIPFNEPPLENSVEELTLAIFHKLVGFGPASLKKLLGV
jgi:hypothetical protein